MKLKSKLSYSLLMIVLGAGFAGYCFYEFSTVEVPQMESAQIKVNGEITKKTVELKRLQDFVQNIERVKLELRELNVQLETALEHMPRTFNLSGLLRRFTLLAQNSGIELATFKPKKNEEKKAGAFYSTIGIDFELRGTFTQTLVFLDQLSRLKRIINVDQLKMRVQEALPTRGGAVIASTQASILTYRFSE